MKIAGNLLIQIGYAGNFSDRENICPEFLKRAPILMRLTTEATDSDDSLSATLMEGERSIPRESANLKEPENQVLRMLIEHRTSLFAYVLAVMRDYNAAEEVLQEISVAVVESAGQFELGTNFSAWTREIARRRIQAYWKSRDRQPLTLSEDSIDRLEQGFELAQRDLPDGERAQALVKCLEKLSPFMRHLFELRFGSRKNLQEISEEVNRPSETIRKALYRGRVLLRNCIDRRLKAALKDS